MDSKDFNYRGKWASEMTKKELIDVCMEMFERERSQVERHRNEMDSLFSLTREQRKGGLLARLIGY